MMKKNRILIVFILIWAGTKAFAQEVPVINNLDIKAQGVSPAAYDQHLGILTVKKGANGAELLAVDDRNQILWRKELETEPGVVGRFKDKIVVFIAAKTAFRAMLLDPINGNTLLDRAFLNRNPSDFMETVRFYTNNGAFLKLFIGQSTVPAKKWAFTPKDLYTLSKLEAIDLNEKLEVSSRQVFEPGGKVLLGMRYNQSGDLFLGWLDNTTLEIDKYEAGKDVPSGKLTSTIAPLKSMSVLPESYVRIVPSTTDRDVVFYGTMQVNGDKETEFELGRFDMRKLKATSTNMVINKTSLKAMAAGFVPVNKSLGEVDLNDYKRYELRYLDDADGKIVAVFSSSYPINSNIGGGSWIKEGSLLVCGYDAYLKPVFQQFLPSGYAYPEYQLSAGYWHQKDKLFIVANYTHGINEVSSVYGALDLIKGQWEKMIYLSKKDIGNSVYSQSRSILWLGDAFIVPYLSKGLSLQMSRY